MTGLKKVEKFKVTKQSRKLREKGKSEKEIVYNINL